MLDLLLEQRAAGETEFARAWRRASRQIPRPRDFTHPELDDPGWMPFSTFFRVACEREWRGVVFTDYLGLREMLEDGGLSTAHPREMQAAGSRVKILA